MAKSQAQIYKPYLTFKHVKHKIDDKNTATRAVVNPVNKNYVRLPSFSHVKPTIPKNSEHVQFVDKKPTITTEVRTSMERMKTQNESHVFRQTSSVEAMVNYGHNVSSQSDKDIAEYSNQVFFKSDSTTKRKKRMHLLSEIQRKRIALIFESGSRLLTIPFPFLIIYTLYSWEQGKKYIADFFFVRPGVITKTKPSIAHAYIFMFMNDKS